MCMDLCRVPRLRLQHGLLGGMRSGGASVRASLLMLRLDRRAAPAKLLLHCIAMQRAFDFHRELHKEASDVALST